MVLSDLLGELRKEPAIRGLAQVRSRPPGVSKNQLGMDRRLSWTVQPSYKEKR